MNQAPVPDRNLKQWAALFVLVLLAMGATLIRIQNQPVEPGLVVPPAPAPVTQSTPSDTTVTKPAAAALPVTSAAAGSASARTSVSTNDPVGIMTAVLYDKAHYAIDNIANKAIQVTDKPRPVTLRTAEPAVARPPAAGSAATPGSAAQ